MVLLLMVCAFLVASSYGIPKKYESSSSDSTVSGNEKLCTSVDCLKRAYDIKAAMDFNIDPCDDFYKFACGRFLNVTRIPDDKDSYNIFSTVGDDLLERGRDLLEEKPKEGDWKLDELPKSLYKDCMDDETIEKLGIVPAKEVVQQLGGWLGNSKPWFELVVDLVNAGFASNKYIIEVTVDIDDKMNEKRIIYLDQPDFGIKREYFVNNDRPIIEAYEKYIKDTAILFGMDPHIAEQEMKKIIELEAAMANASLPREERRDANKLYNPYVIKDVPRSAGHPPSWTDYVQKLVALGGVTIDSNEKIIVKTPSYLEKLGAILERTDNETVNFYLIWRCLESVLDHLNKASRAITQEFEKVTEGKKEQPPRWKQCTKTAGIDNLEDELEIQGLDLVSGSMYVRRFLKPAAKAQLLTMTKHIRRAFKKVLDDLDWMDKETKDQAYVKLEKMLENIGYPDEVIDEEKMNKLHAGIEWRNGHFFVNMLHMTRFWNAKLMSRLRDKVDRKFWLDNYVNLVVAVANAFYSPNSNSMSFPAGFLSGLMFNAEVPKYANYGGIGNVIGHEISHGFDDEGRLTDATGVLTNWWSNDTAAKFTEKTQCVVDQFNNFEAKEVGLKLNGIATQGENIADIVGAKIAHMAYGFWMEENGVEPELPGLPFTPQQMFWIARARTMCSKYTEAKLKKEVITDSHSPFEFRVNAPSMDLESFAKDFECLPGSVMNPVKKCVVW